MPYFDHEAKSPENWEELVSHQIRRKTLFKIIGGKLLRSGLSSETSNSLEFCISACQKNDNTLRNKDSYAGKLEYYSEHNDETPNDYKRSLKPPNYSCSGCVKFLPVDKLLEVDDVSWGLTPNDILGPQVLTDDKDDETLNQGARQRDPSISSETTTFSSTTSLSTTNASTTSLSTTSSSTTASSTTILSTTILPITDESLVSDKIIGPRELTDDEDDESLNMGSGLDDPVYGPGSSNGLDKSVKRKSKGLGCKDSSTPECKRIRELKYKKRATIRSG